MRVAWFLLLAACYQPNATTPCFTACTTDCPPGLTCRNGRCEAAGGGCPIDAPEPDAPMVDGDAPPQACTPSTTPGTETDVLAGATWFIATASYGAAFTQEIVGSEQPLNAGSYSPILQNQVDKAFAAPRLGPTGDQLFFRIEPVPADGTASLGRINRSGANWGTIDTQIINGTNMSDQDDPSPPTTTSPRRMVFSRSSGFAELQETPPKTWTVVHVQPMTTYALADATPVSFLGQAHLTEDGLRLVFRGQVPSSLVGAFYLQRQSLAQNFANPARQLPAATSVTTPYFRTDCSTLFYSAPGPVVKRVVY